ncbi:MAG: hypothetical protein HUK21_09300 [Fibrobacteraceae bacterium]|nr:hypothetical protein [Fibrobacteraceae bacterium]
MPYKNNAENTLSDNIYDYYGYNVFGAEESYRVQNNPLENYVDDRDYIINQQWEQLLAQITEQFRPIAKKLDEQKVEFNSINDNLVLDQKEGINNDCSDIVSSSQTGRYFGCTTQNSWHDDLNKPYIKPNSTTYLAREWALDFIKDVELHELSHQAIISTRQMIAKDHEWRRQNNLHSMSDSMYNAYMNLFSKYDNDLDNMDKAWMDIQTGKIVMKKRSNILSNLNALVDMYREHVQ